MRFPVVNVVEEGGGETPPQLELFLICSQKAVTPLGLCNIIPEAWSPNEYALWSNPDGMLTVCLILANITTIIGNYILLVSLSRTFQENSEAWIDSYLYKTRVVADLNSWTRLSRGFDHTIKAWWTFLNQNTCVRSYAQCPGDPCIFRRHVIEQKGQHDMDWSPLLKLQQHSSRKQFSRLQLYYTYFRG